jgi:hypothetical protein
LIHRDIKPANLLLAGEPGAFVGAPSSFQLAQGEEGQLETCPHNSGVKVKITDFGLARLVDDVGLTQSGVVAGTPEYMAPEQARGERIDHRTDLFSLGSVLYALCTGQPPFRGSTAMAVLLQVSHQDPTPIRALNADVPLWLEALITRLLAKDPADRFQSAAEVATLLEGYLAHLRQPADCPVLPLPPAAGKSGSRGRFGARIGWLALVLAAFLALVVGITISFAGVGDQPASTAKTPHAEHWSLQGDPADGKGFELTGPDAAACVRRERDGTVIALPAGHPGTRPSTGLHIPSTVRGDFEFTVRFEVLQAPTAAEAGPEGTRFTLGVLLERPGLNTASLSWARNSQLQGGTGWIPSLTLMNETTGANESRVSAAPTQAKSGRLRIVRTGSLLTYYAAEGLSEEFLHLTEVPFAPEDVKDVLVVGSTGGPQAALTVRVTDLYVRSQPAPVPAGDPQPALPRKHFRVWLVVAGFLGLGLIGMLWVGLWLSRQHQAAAREQEAEHPAEDTSPPRAPANPAITFRCSGCGKNLRARAALAGKSFKCPQCGQGVLVPETNPGSQAPRASTDRFSILKYRRVIASVLVLAVVAGVGGRLFWPRRVTDYSFLHGTLGNRFVPEVQESGFYPEEHSKAGKPFRWTDGKGKLVIPIDRRKPPAWLVVELDIRRPAEVKTAWVQIVANHRVLIRHQMALWKGQGGSVGKLSKSLDLTGVDLGDELVLEILSDTFTPKADQRELGVLVVGMELRQEAPSPQ